MRKYKLKALDVKFHLIFLLSMTWVWVSGAIINANFMCVCMTAHIDSLSRTGILRRAGRPCQNHSTLRLLKINHWHSAYWEKDSRSSHHILISKWLQREVRQSLKRFFLMWSEVEMNLRSLDPSLFIRVSKSVEGRSVNSQQGTKTMNLMRMGVPAPHILHHHSRNCNTLAYLHLA